MKPMAATAAAIAGAVALAALTAAGAGTYLKATKPSEDDDRYAAVAPASYPGSRLVDAMTATDTDGAKMKAIQQSEAPLVPERCQGDDTPDRTMLYARSGKGERYSITAQAYGAGQARKAYDGLARQLPSCASSVRTSGRDGMTYTEWKGGYLITAGDAIVSLTVRDVPRQKDIADGVLARLSDQLHRTGCVALDEKADDSDRSFYFDDKAYKGLTRVEEVSATRKRVDMSVPQNLADAGGRMEDLYKGPAVRSAPEAPLPDGMKDRLPQAPPIPVIAKEAAAPPQTDAITYQVKDTLGPGCGWAWSGQKAPKYDDGALQADYRKIKGDAVKSLDDSILAYNSNARTWSMSAMLSMRFVNTWHRYLDSANGIIDSWNKLDSGRASFRPAWDGYIGSLRDWETRRLGNQAAMQDRDAAVGDCVDGKRRDWESKDGNGKADDTMKDRWRHDCDATVPKAEVTPETPEPKAPAPPDGITIPQSWPTRDSTVAQADAAFKADRDAAKRKRDEAEAKEKADAQANHDQDQAGQGDGQRPKPSPGTGTSSPSPSPSPSPSSPSPSPSPQPSDSGQNHGRGSGAEKGDGGPDELIQ